MSVLIAIINYRTGPLTVDCLRSLVPELDALPGSRVIVADNASGDGSADQIQRAVADNGWGERMSVLRLERNGGFAYGNNACIRVAQQTTPPYRYVHLLNPDTIVRPGGITELIKFMDARPDVGIAGSRLEDPDGTPQRSAFRFPSVLSEFADGVRIGAVSKLLGRWIVAPPASDVACPTDWIAGASFMIRPAVFDAIGLMDEGYFMYFEEVDFCLRARRAGWPTWYVPSSHVVHLVGQASGVTGSGSSRKPRPKYWFDSRRRYFVKNHGRGKAALADAAFATGFATWRLRVNAMRRHDPDPPHLLGDFLRNSVFRRGFAT